MYYEDRTPGMTFLAGLILGAAVGVGMALLLAPQSGKRTRRQIARVASTARTSATDRWGDITDDVRSIIRGGQRRRLRR
jgi:gas vesicle protein